MKPFHIIALLTAVCLPTYNVAYAQQAPTPVFVSMVKPVHFVDEVEALGTLKANENVDLVSNVTERITAINFEDNQTVEKGDVLVEMDSRQEQAELTEETYLRDEARRQVNRLKPLVERGAAARSLLDEQERDLNASTARIKAIQSRIDERRIVAPFDGVVGIRNISVGDMAMPGNGQSDAIITTIDDISTMKLDFSVPEIFLSTLKPGIKVEAQTSAYPDRTFEGTISSINSRVDPMTRSVSARAILENEDQALKAGMLMRIKLSNNPRQALIVPEESIITAGRNNTVMVVVEKDGKTIVESRPVEIGARRKGDVEILKGVSEGDKVVTHGALRARPGMAVEIKAVEENDETLTELLNQNKTKSKTETE